VISPEHEEVISVWHRQSGLHVIIAIHSTVRGPALGGSRFRPYPTLDAAFAEACDLAQAMSYKAAVAQLPLGGGKAVLIGDPTVSKTTELLADYAGVLNSLDGRYITAEDVGTTMADMDELHEQTKFVAGTSIERGGSGDPSPHTAYGILCAMQAASAQLWGTRDLAGRHVAVSGLGKVGAEVARLLSQRGCKLTLADVSPRAVEAVIGHDAVAADVVDPDEVHRTKCDIFSPCALGGALNYRTVPELRCLAIVGAANNQLTSPELADDLSARTIAYVPDFVANAGGIINIANEYLGYDEDRATKQVEQIFDTTQSILRRSAFEGTTPLAAAVALAKERLSTDQGLEVVTQPAS